MFLFLMSFCSILLALSNDTSFFLYDFPMKRIVKNTILIPAQYKLERGILLRNSLERSDSSPGITKGFSVGDSRRMAILREINI